ncbi:hypothetical protein ACR9E3_22550 [Actinomycetospora sp. C-140]
MTVEADNGDELLLVCPVSACGRRVVLRRGGGFVVIDRGDFFAMHSGGSLGLSMSASVDP